MRAIITVILIAFNNIAWGQLTYTSTTTETFSPYDIEHINRKIVISDSLFTIVSENKAPANLQAWTIVEKEIEGSNKIYKCIALDGTYPTIFMIYNFNSTVKRIEALKPLDYSGKDYSLIRYNIKN